MRLGLRLTIKGRPSDDAVLCTTDSTFLLRTVSISNSLVILRTPTSNPIPPLTSVPTSSSTSTSTATAIGTSPASESRPTLEIRDVCHEVLECVPQAANLERIRTVLRPTQWEGLGKRTRAVELGSTNKARRWTKAQLESVVQASQVELDAGLRERNVVQFNGRCHSLLKCHVQPWEAK